MKNSNFVILNNTININSNLTIETIQKEKEFFLNEIIDFSNKFININEININDFMKILNNVDIENYKCEDKEVEILIKIYSSYEIDCKKYDRDNFLFIKNDKSPLFEAIFKINVFFIKEELIKIKNINLITIHEIGVFITDLIEVKDIYIKTIEKYVNNNLLKFIQQNNIKEIEYKNNFLKINIELFNTNLDLSFLIRHLLINIFPKKNVNINIYKYKNNVEFCCAIEK